MKSIIPASILLILLIFINACSSRSSNPVGLDTSLEDFTSVLPVLEEPGKLSVNHHAVGLWTAIFDIDNLTADVTQNRELLAHYDVTQFIDPPLIDVNSWDPVEMIIDVDVTIYNPTMIVVYDPRLIIYTDDVGHLLVNHDGLTPLFDIPGGFNINPFKAYCKNESQRAFGMQQWKVENLKIKCPQNNFNVQFAFEVSYPSNCDEPYEINNFQQGDIYDRVGSSTTVYVDVKDWQNDADEVILSCNAITGQASSSMTHQTGDRWSLTLSNNNGASAGEYPALIMASSQNSIYLCNIVSIEVSEYIQGIPSDPQLVDIFMGGMGGSQAVLDGNYLFSLGSDIYTTDITDPHNPRTIGVLYLSTLHQSSMVGKRFYENLGYLYLFSGSFGLDIIDKSNPENLFITKTIDLGEGAVNAVSMNGMYMYVGIHKGHATEPTAFTVFDISDPLNPVKIGECETQYTMFDMDLNGNYAYCTGYQENLSVVDISDPANPRTVNTLVTPEKYYQLVYTHDDYMFLCGYMSPIGGLYLYSLADPENPEYIDFVLTEQDSVLREVFFTDDHMFLNRHNDLYIYDVVNPEDLTEIAVYESSWGVYCFCIEENFAFSGSSYGLEFIDISDPYNPVQISQMPKFELGIGLVKDDYALMQEYEKLHVYDISTPENIEYAYTWQSSNHSYEIKDLFLNNNTLCLEHDDGRFSLLDFTDPLNLVEITTTEEYGSNLSWFVFETPDAFSAEAGFYTTPTVSEIQRVNVSDPYNPIGSRVTIDGFSYGSFAVDKTHSWLYLVNLPPPGYTRQLTVVDISDPNSMNVAASFPDIYGEHYQIADDVLYVNNRPTHAYDLYDISEPLQPTLISSIDTHPCRNYEVDGNYLYLISELHGTRYSNFVVYDISDPSNPVHVSTYQPFGEYGKLGDFYINDNYGYVNLYGGVAIIKLW